MRENAAKHDADASAHIRLSRLLVSAGLGIPARMEAEQSTKIDPNSSQAWQALAWAWQNDSFGRLRRGDWNRVEAIKDLRKAVELDTDDIIAKADLAILLDYNDRGERYGKGSDPAESVALYREVLKNRPNAVFESNLTATLFYSGQIKEASEEAKKCSDNQRILFQAVLRTIQDGPGPAIVALQTEVLDPATRSQFLVSVALTLLQLRHYPEALTFAQAAARVSSTPQLSAAVQLISRFKRREDDTIPDSDPRSAEQKLILTLFQDEKFSLDRFKELFVTVPTEENWEEELRQARDEAFSGFRPLAELGLNTENFVDMTLSAIILDKEGDDDHGYRIFTTQGSSSMPTMFVVRTGGAYKILGSTDSLDVIGHRVLDLLKQKNIEGAQWWLDKAVPGVPIGQDGWLPAVRGLWSGTVASTRGPDAIRVAAASLIGRGEGSAEAVAILKEAYPKAPNAIEKAQIDLALCETYAKSKQWHELVEVSSRLMASKTFNTAGFNYLVRAYEGQKDWKGLEAAVLLRTKDRDAPREAWRYVAIARIFSGNWDGAAEAIDKFKASAIGSEAAELGAWNDILRKSVSDGSLDSINKTNYQAADLHDKYLVAMLKVKMKKPEDAQDALKQAIQNKEAAGLDAQAWIIYGDICQQYAFPEAAASAWARARSAPPGTREAQWALSTIPVTH